MSSDEGASTRPNRSPLRRMVRSAQRHLPPADRRTEMVRFGLVGLGNFALDLTLFNVLHYAFGIAPVVANTVSYSAGIISAYLWHRHWTFSRLTPGRALPTQVALFFGCNLIGLGLSNIVVWALSPLLTAAGAKIASLGVTYIWNYWSTRRFVFAPVAVAGTTKTG